MTTAARIITPKKSKEFPEYLDFDRLRAEGILHIQALAGQIWTDHNTHDPGITILELLCYALTDLGYRTNLNIRDLLAQPAPAAGDTNPPADTNFPTAAHVLSCNPITILDLRKLLIDTEGVRNAWLTVVEKNTTEPSLGVDVDTSQLALKPSSDASVIHLNGLYTVLLELDDAYLSQQAVKGVDATGTVLEKVNQKLHAHRNLCEGYLRIAILRDEKISLCGEIELSANANPDDVMLAILDQVQEFLSPTISFYTLNEMRQKGFTTDQIFEGRPLIPVQDESFGFVDVEQLKNAERRNVIYVSDLYRVLLAIEGVTAIKNFRLVNLTNGTNPEGEEWILPLTPNTFRPVLDALKSVNSLVLSKRNVIYGVDSERVLNFFAKKIANRLKVPKKPGELDLPITLGTYRGGSFNERNSSFTDGLGYHFSIQNDLPAAYGTSGVSFPDRDATADERERQAQALQLKGYLLFFDQILANYLSQLANVRSLFSTKLDPDTDSVLSIGRLDDVAFLDKLLPFAAAPGSQNPIIQLFSEGDRIAKAIDPATGRRLTFRTPSELDAALNQVIKAFNADSTIVTTELDTITNRYHFRIQSQGIHPVALLSAKTYTTKEDAQAAFGRVRFLATLDASYVRRQQGPAGAHRYTFDWLFHWPTDFGQIMRQSIENRAAYLRRKSALFDHLLARFAEDFTDYTLLMFGLNKNSTRQLSDERMAHDKAAFIEAYPDISRNRSIGFNQLLPSSTYWQGKNVSGLENRLATMLGFNRRENKQLNFFEIVADQRQQFFFHDRQGIRLLQSPQSSRIGGLAGFRKAIQEAAKESNTFKATHCEPEHVFGFRLTDQANCLLAVHPDTYGTAEARDAMLRYTRLVTRDPDRLPVDFVTQYKGFYANVLKPDGSLIFQAAVATSTWEEARLVALAIRRAAADENLYKKLPGSAKGFGFQLRSRPKQAGNAKPETILATHPQYYLTADERNDAITQTVRFFAKNPLRLQVQQRPLRHYWMVPLSNGNRLESLHSFKTSRQTRAAANRVLALSNQARRVEIQSQYDGTFRIQLIELRTYPSAQPTERPHIVRLPLAQTQPIATHSEAEQLVGEIRRILHPNTIQVHTKPAQFYTQLTAPDEGVWLRDVRLFATADEAEMAFDDVLEATCQGTWLNDDSINNGCAHGFSLVREPSGEVLATHPVQYDTASDRNDVTADIQRLACAHRIRFEAEERSDSWQFELLWPNSEGSLSAMFREPTGSTHASEDESRQFFESNVRKFLTAFQPSFIESTGQPGSYSFQMKVNEQILAEHPDTYALARDRNTAIEKLTNYLTDTNVTEKLVGSLQERFTLSSTEEDHIAGFVTILTDDCPTKTPNPDRRRWRIRDAKAPIALYQRPLKTKREIQACLDRLILHYRCQTPRYSDLVIGEGAISPDNHWLIRDKTQVMWRSLNAYGSEAETRQAFEATLMRVISTSLDLDNYQINPVVDSATNVTRYRIDLLDNHYQIIAVSDLFDSAVLAQQGIGQRHNYARLFPFYVSPEGIYFHLYNVRDQRSDWRSTAAYKTWQEALDGFMTFLDMLGFESHYDLIGDEECGWQIALTEVLLESANSFIVGSIENEEPAETPGSSACNWQLSLNETLLEGTNRLKDPNAIKPLTDTAGWDQVEDFLDRYQTTDETRVARPYIDYTNGCQYRFQLVSDTYALARHPIAFYTHAEREIRRDELFLLWQNNPNLQVDPGPLLRKILEKIPSFSRSAQPLTNLFVVVEPDGYLLGVRDETTGLRFVFEDKKYASEAELIEAVRTMYVELNSNPQVDRVDGSKGFEIRVAASTETYQLAGLTNAYAFPRYDVIWESTQSYTSQRIYDCAFKRCWDLLTEKSAYSRYQAADQSFTLMLTDSAEVLATQPRRYPTFLACSEAIEHTLAYVDTEGFHLIEHVLLRPRTLFPTVANPLLPIQVSEQDLKKIAAANVKAVVDEQDRFDAYVAGSDPYSMTATVVLPYWPRRFRSVDFRQFFENTLRRETPVHILLNIVWISPEQMQRFENSLACWLEDIAQPLSPQFAQRTARLVNVMGQLTNTFPHAMLNDCNGAPIILDETTID